MVTLLIAFPRLFESGRWIDKMSDLVRFCRTLHLVFRVLLSYHLMAVARTTKVTVAGKTRIHRRRMHSSQSSAERIDGSSVSEGCSLGGANRVPDAREIRSVAGGSFVTPALNAQILP
jgi:hypothetical protein